MIFKMNNDAHETLIMSLKHNLPLFINYSGFGSFWKSIFSIYPGGIGTQNSLVKTPTLARILKKFEEVFGGS